MARLWYDEDQENVNEKIKQLLRISNPKKVIENAQQYFNDPNIKVYLSTRKKSKYAIYDPINKKLVHFGQFDPPMEDYTKHLDDKRRQNYLLRASNIRGSWQSNPYSPNNMSIHILWQ
jgi:Family of unknown function (DUF5754)